MNPAQAMGGVTMNPGVRWDSIETCKEVHPTEVAEHVRKGWVILMSYAARDDVIENYWENGMNQQRVRCEYCPVVLMGQMNLDALRAENEDLKTRNKALAESDQQHQKLRTEHEALKRGHTSSKEFLELAEKRATEADGKRREAEEQKRRLEVDIGKVRSAIGDLRMREILEGKV